MTGAEFFPSDRVTIVGVLNVTPDSFSDGGRLADASGLVDVAGAVALAKDLLRCGADIIDVGGESTRPGAVEVDPDIEIARTEPVIAAIAEQLDVPISIDTRKAAVARAALRAGARIVNDVSGLRHDCELAAVTAEAAATLIVGHMRGTPADMQSAPRYDDVLGEVGDELAASLVRARAAGVANAALVADPGIGFAKQLEDNLALLANAATLRDRLGVPLLVGPSRKSFLGTLTGDPVDQRDTATVAACAVAVFAGADAIRVHDVAGARRAAQVAQALRGAETRTPRNRGAPA